MKSKRPLLRRTDTFARKEDSSIKIYLECKVSASIVFSRDLRSLNRIFHWRNNPRSVTCLTTLQANCTRDTFPAFWSLRVLSYTDSVQNNKCENIFLESPKKSKRKRKEKKGKSPESYLWSVEGIGEVKNQKVFNEMTGWSGVVKKRWRERYDLRVVCCQHSNFDRSDCFKLDSMVAIKRSRFRITRKVQPIILQSNVIELTYCRLSMSMKLEEKLLWRESETDFLFTVELVNSLSVLK